MKIESVGTEASICALTIGGRNPFAERTTSMENGKHARKAIGSVP